MEGSLRFLFSDGSLRFDVEVKSCGFHVTCFKSLGVWVSHKCEEAIFV